jgi:hypothetical protein
MTASELPPQEREAFEKEITRFPYEKDVRRFPDNDRQAWPGNYRDIDVDLAWQMWQERALQAQALAPCEFCEANKKLADIALRAAERQQRMGHLAELHGSAPAAREADERSLPRGWIGVEERMPERPDIYIVWLKDPLDTGWNVDRAWTAQAFSDGEWGECSPLEDGCEVTHWMPLPAAPTGVPQDSEPT